MAALFCAAISCSTSAKSSRTRSKIPFANWTAKAILEVHLGRRAVPLDAQPEKTPEIRRRRSGNFFAAQVSHTRKRLRYLHYERRLVSFSAPSLRRQKRRIRFRQQALER